MGGAVDAIPKDNPNEEIQKDQESKGFFGWLSGKK
jgi:hypothetical protein